MPRLLDSSPFPPHHTEVVLHDERVRLRPDQIVVWVSITLQRVKAPNPSSVPFPVILDTGHNHTFSIHERHLTNWARLRPDMLNLLGTIRDRGQRLPLRAAKLWVHPNEPQSRERLADRAPFPLAAPRGIAVYPGSEFPRLPILGLRAIAENELVLKVDGMRREASLRTPIRWWPFW